MDAVVPPEITAELTQILSNLVLGDNAIRQSAERAVNERLAHTPEVYILALAQFANRAETDVMRTFSLVLLRRLLFRPAPAPSAQAGSSPHTLGMGSFEPSTGMGMGSTTRLLLESTSTSPFFTQTHASSSGASSMFGTASSSTSSANANSNSNSAFPPGTASSSHPPTLYDHLPLSTLSTLERLLLYSLSHEPNGAVRRRICDTVGDVALQAMQRGRMWHALQARVFAMARATDAGAAIGGGEYQAHDGHSDSLLPQGSAPAILQRESAYRIFAHAPQLVMDLQMDVVLGVLQGGLRDPEHIEVRHAALLASVAFLSAADPTQLAQSISLLSAILALLAELASTLHQPPLGAHLANTNSPVPPPTSTPPHYLTLFISALTPLACTHPILFNAHLERMLGFLPALVLPQQGDCGPTPTVGRPFPGNAGKAPAVMGGVGMGVGMGMNTGLGMGAAAQGRQGAFVFPPVGSGMAMNGNGDNSDNQVDDQVEDDEDDDDDAQLQLRLTALEFMLSLAEARPSMIRQSAPGWAAVVVRACLEGMGMADAEGASTGSSRGGYSASSGSGSGMGGSMGGKGSSGDTQREREELDTWRAEDPSAGSGSADMDSPPALYEQSLDRIACAMGGKAVLPPAFQYIPSMMHSFDWRVRQAGLLAIAAMGEGTGKVMQKELKTIVEMVTPMFKDPHPRVRWAACQCVGQLCTDLEEVIQKRYHQQLFSVLIPALEDPEPRVHAHAASALINFCEGVERDTLIPYLDPIVARLLHLLNPGNDTGAVVHRYVQEQAITTLAMVADASETTFGTYYPTIMPLLLNVLRNADGGEYRKLRVKAMECAGLIAIAVGPDVFRPDSQTLIELLMRIQNQPVDPNDTQLGHYLMSTWAKLCQAMGNEFERFLPVVMPSLLSVAAQKADLSVYDEDDYTDEREDWETIVLDGKTYGMRTSAMEEKCQAFETLVIYASTLGAGFAPYVESTLGITLPCLKFYFHEGVREACAMLIPALLAAGKQGNVLTNDMVSAIFTNIISCISTEHECSFLASLYKYFSDSLRVIGGPPMLSPQFHNGLMEATKRQLQTLADRRRTRGQLVNTADFDREEMALLEEIEDFALEDMGKTLSGFDPNHPLLVAVASVRDLGFNTYDSDDDYAGYQDDS